MASGKSLELRWIMPTEKVYWDTEEKGAYVNHKKDRRLAGKKRIRQRKLTQRS